MTDKTFQPSDTAVGRLLDLVSTMADDSHTAAELAEVLGTSKRNLYYVIKQLEKYGFVIRITVICSTPIHLSFKTLPVR